MSSSNLFSRDEVLGGLVARRANTLLFLIESRTARLTAQARQAMVPFRSDQVSDEDELEFFAAFSEGKDPPFKPTIQDIETLVGRWARLVPNEPRMKAALAHALAAKYVFTLDSIPGIRAVLGLEEIAVQQAFQNLYGKPVSSIYQAKTGIREQLRWMWSRLAGWIDTLPPFWTSFALTFTETVGSGILALPIALAGIGPLPGIFLLVIFGLVNVITITCAAEAAARSGNVRYGSGFLGRMVGDYLGSFGSSVLTIGLALFSAIQLFATYIGFGAAMGPLTSLPPTVWIIALFLIGLYFLRRESLDATIASALLVGAASIVALVLLMILAIDKINLSNLSNIHIPFVNGEPFKPVLLELIFGVVLAAFFGHMSVNNCARVVLRRDASAKSLIGGAALAQITSILLYSIWTLVVAGAVPPEILARETGTALEPLVSRIGPVAVVLGTIYALITLAMGSIYNALSLYNLVSERLPTHKQLILSLPCRRGQLVLTPRRDIRGLFRQSQKNVRLGISYLGLDGTSKSAARPRMRLDISLGKELHNIEITPGIYSPAVPNNQPKRSNGQQQGSQARLPNNKDRSGMWNESALTGLIPDLYRHGINLGVDVLEANSSTIRFSVSSTMAMRYEGRWESAGFDLANVLSWADTERRIWKWLSRRQEFCTEQEIIAGAGIDESSALKALKTLVGKDLVRQELANGKIRYQARFAARRSRSLPEKLDLGTAVTPKGKRDILPDGAVRSQPAFWASLNRRSRYALCSLPALVVFLFSEWLMLGGKASFSMAFSLSGVLLGSILAGFFPVLLLSASRRKGDVVPGLSPRLTGHPIILGLVYLIYLAGVMLYGLVIWKQPIERGLALGVGLLAIVMPAVMKWRGAFRRRTVIELRATPGETCPAVYAISTSGKPHAVNVQLSHEGGGEFTNTAGGEIRDFTSLRSITFRSALGQESGKIKHAQIGNDIKIWAHATGEDGDDRPLPVTTEICNEDSLDTYDLGAMGGQVVLPLTNPGFDVQVLLPAAPKDA